MMYPWSLILILLLFEIAHAQNKYNLNTQGSVDSDSLAGDLIYSGGEFRFEEYQIGPLQPGYKTELITNLVLSITLELDSILHFKITDKFNKRWEAGEYIVSDDYRSKSSQYANKLKLKDVGLSFQTNPFQFAIKDKDSLPLFQFTNNKFFYTNNLVCFSAAFSSEDIYGWGQRSGNFKIIDGVHTSWPVDSGTPWDDGTGAKNQYGIQPFLINRAKNGKYVGLLEVSTNPQDLLLYNNLNLKYIEFRALGGILEFYIFIEDNPNNLIQKLHSVLGKPVLPPYWSLGWHQCRYGYKSSEDLKGVIKNYEFYALPVDTFWTDIDYMQDYRDFTVDLNRFGDLSKIVDSLHSKGKRFVPILDLGIPKNSTDPAYNEGMSKNLFLQSNYTGNPLIQIVWPGKCHFPDFFNPQTSEYWNKYLNILYHLVEYDGLWLDMNEPASIYDAGRGIGEVDAIKDPSKNSYAYIPYLPGYGKNDLVSHTVSVNAKVYNYNNGYSYLTTYNTKVLQAYLETFSSYKFLTRFNQRSFILSRSNIIGMGRHSYVWLGDNYSTYESMKASITGVFSYGMFGFSLVGSDVCGFMFDAWDSLCARWHTLGAFYPFARNHNTINAKLQEPYQFGANSLTFKSAMLALSVRYSLLRYIYTELLRISKDGGQFFSPLFFQFPKDPRAFKEEVDTNIMLGSALKFNPVLTDSEDDFESYFPNTNWNNLLKGQRVFSFKQGSSEGGKIVISGKHVNLNLFIKGGSIIPYQIVDSITKSKSYSSADMLNTPLTIVINTDDAMMASGVIGYDDGKTIGSIACFYNITFKNDIISFTSIPSCSNFSQYQNKDIILTSFYVLSSKGSFQSCVGKSRAGKILDCTVQYDKAVDMSIGSLISETRLDELDQVTLLRSRMVNK